MCDHVVAFVKTAIRVVERLVLAQKDLQGLKGFCFNL